MRGKHLTLGGRMPSTRQIVQALVATTSAALLVTGCGGGKTHHAALEGWAIAGHPLAGATIEAVDANGKVIATSPEKTLATGTWYLPLDHPAARMTIVAHGGTDGGHPFTGTLRNVVVGYSHARPRAIHINPATTLVAAYLARHRSASRQQGINAVRRFLGVPRTGNLESNLRASDTYFSGTQFMHEAKTAGGIGHFVTQLERNLDAGKSHAFLTTHKAAARTLQADSLGTVVAAADTIGPLKVLQGISSGLSIVSGIVGLIRGGQVQSEISAIDGQLTTIEGQVSDLGGVVDALAAQDNKHAYSNAISSGTRGLETQLAIVYPLYQLVLQSAGGSADQIASAITNFENAIYVPNGVDYRDTWRGGSGGVGLDGIYSDLVGQGTAEGALQAWSDYAGTSATRFISAATQTRAAQALAYWVNVQVEVLAVDAAYEDAYNNGTVTTTTTGTTTTAATTTTTNPNAVSMGTAQAVASFGGANATAASTDCVPSGGTTSSANLLLNEYNASHACFQPVGTGVVGKSVWIDQATNLMWEYNGTFNAQPYDVFAASNQASAADWGWPNVADPNWQRPSIGQLQTLGSFNQGNNGGWNVSNQYSRPIDMLAQYAQIPSFQGLLNVAAIPDTRQPFDYVTVFWSSTSGDCSQNYLAHPTDHFCYQQTYDFLNGNSPWFCTDPTHTDPYGCSSTADNNYANNGTYGDQPIGYFDTTHTEDWADWLYERTVPASEGPYGGS
jgi:hypothetical protein